MKKSIILIFILVSVFFTSCKDEQTLSELYNEKDYETLLVEAKKMCKRDMTKDSLFYLMMGYYNQSMLSDAVELAYLYKTLYPDIDNNYKVALTILMYNDKTIEAYYAAQELNNNYQSLTLTDYSLYFKLASNYDRTEALHFYNEVSQKLSNREKLIVLSNGYAPTIQVISALERYYQETKGNADYQSMLTKILENYVKQDTDSETSILLNFAENTINDNPKGEIYLGDLYYKLGYKSAASKHWNAALVDYPAEVKSRLFKYK